MKIRSLKISNQFVFENHNVNANESASPKSVDGKSYISGQKLRYMMLNAICDLNDNKEYIVSTGDAPLCNITKDLRSDIGGYMDAGNKETYANKRTSPLRVSFSVSKNKSKYFDDLFVRFKTNPLDVTANSEQRINTKTYSHKDVFNVNVSLDCVKLSSIELFDFDEKNKFIKKEVINLVDEKERKRRVSLVIQSLVYLQGLANQSRNAVENKAVKTFICFDTIDSFEKYFDKTEVEQQHFLTELDNRGAKYFIGSSENTDGITVEIATRNAIDYLNKELVELVNNSTEVKSHEQLISEMKAKMDELKEIEAKKREKTKGSKKGKKSQIEETDSDDDMGSDEE